MNETTASYRLPVIFVDAFSWEYGTCHIEQTDRGTNVTTITVTEHGYTALQNAAYSYMTNHEELRVRRSAGAALGRLAIGSPKELKRRQEFA